MDDKRKSRRISSRIKSEVHASRGMTFSTSQDLSRGGIYISTPEPLEKGSEISLSLYLPGQDPLSLRGIVRWSTTEEASGRRCGMGIEFCDACDGDLEKIDTAIK
ncbi:MAG: PilZ domain-containing protein [Spirochaetes bacterium]|nr:PilZ domain-containing protein [Spirochaetota bacterium]